eukprot:c27712_g1_i1 orf=1-408(-)
MHPSEDSVQDCAKKLNTLSPSHEIKLAVQEYVKKHHTSSPSLSIHSPYHDVAGLPNAYHIFNLHHGGLPAWKRKQAIASAKSYHALQISNFIGYQINQALDYSRDFASYMDIHVNNVGDAFKEGNYTIHSKFMERA